MHDSAVASVSPRSRQASSTSSSTGRSSSANRCRPARSRSARDELVRARLRRPARRTGRRGSRTRARRSSPSTPSPVAARSPRAPARSPTRSRRRSAARAARARARARARAAPAPTRARAARAAAARSAGPGSTTDRARSVSSTSAGAVPAIPTDERALRQRRLLAHARRRSRRTGRSSRSAIAREIDLDLAPRARSSTTSSRPAARATSSTVRSSCVGPRPPETQQRSASQPLAQRGLELVRVVADDRDPRRLDAEPQELRARGTARSGRARSPRTSSLPVTTTNAARAAQAAREKPCGVNEVRAAAGRRATSVAVVDHREVPRVAEVDPEPRARRSAATGRARRVPVKRLLPLARPVAHVHPAVAVERRARRAGTRSAASRHAASASPAAAPSWPCASVVGRGSGSARCRCRRTSRRRSRRRRAPRSRRARTRSSAARAAGAASRRSRCAARRPARAAPRRRRRSAS